MFGIIFVIWRSDTFKFHKSLIFIFLYVTFLSETSMLLRYTNCPDCFDDSFCESLTNGEIRLHWRSKFLLMLNPKLTKSVFYASTDKLGEVVVKSMTRRSQINIKSRKYNLSENILETVISDNTILSDDHIQNVILCKNVRSFHMLFDQIEKNLLNLSNTRNLWLDIPISIEPLLLKFLAPISNISVPRLYGACGDLIFTEFKGKSLSNFYNADWEQQVFLAVQLLNMAETLTFFHPSLIFYLTDISPDNIVVNSFGTISVIDLDHVIISERTEYENGNLSSNNVHVSEVIDPTKLTISPSDICGHSISDHNYYAVCKYMLLDSDGINSGLLSNVPKKISEKHPNFQILLNECGEPNEFDNRITAGRHLKRILEEMIVNFEWKLSRFPKT